MPAEGNHHIRNAPLGLRYTAGCDCCLKECFLHRPHKLNKRQPGSALKCTGQYAPDGRADIHVMMVPRMLNDIRTMDSWSMSFRITLLAAELAWATDVCSSARRITNLHRQTAFLSRRSSYQPIAARVHTHISSYMGDRSTIRALVGLFFCISVMIKFCRSAQVTRGMLRPALVAREGPSHRISTHT
jgi:hypothetical protein